MTLSAAAAGKILRELKELQTSPVDGVRVRRHSLWPLRLRRTPCWCRNCSASAVGVRLYARCVYCLQVTVNEDNIADISAEYVGPGACCGGRVGAGTRAQVRRPGGNVAGPSGRKPRLCTCAVLATRGPRSRSAELASTHDDVCAGMSRHGTTECGVLHAFKMIPLNPFQLERHSKAACFA